MWIKAHWRLINNEKVDALAKAAIADYIDECFLVLYSERYNKVAEGKHHGIRIIEILILISQRTTFF